jgi:hypothetical protein
MGMLESMRLAAAATAEKERVARLRAADQEGHRATFAALQALPSQLIADAAAARRKALERRLVLPWPWTSCALWPAPRANGAALRWHWREL